MTRFALTLEFDGTPFFGLQRQASGPSVQQAVEDARLTEAETRLEMIYAITARLSRLSLLDHL